MSMYDDCMVCKHLLQKTIEKEGVRYMTCKAFPDGIPDEYLNYSSYSQILLIERKGKIIKVKTKPHNKVVSGQTGGYIYEPI